MSFDQQLAPYFSEDGFLAKKLDHYEFRQQQMDMALQVMDAVECKEHLVCEAGTGVGKSLAYLIPLVLHALQSGEKVLISTNTKSLQHQLLEKEIPFLQKYTSLKFRASVALGSQNYLCMRKFHQYRVSPDGLFDDSREQKERMLNWAEHTQEGIRNEIHVHGAVWEEVKREVDLCFGNRCPFFQDCFFFKARRKVASSNIIVANHALTFSDIALNYQLLPACDIILFDEAHNIVNVAQNTLGDTFSNQTLKWSFKKIGNPIRKKGFLFNYKFSDSVTLQYRKLADKFSQAYEVYWEDLITLFDEQESNKLRITSQFVFVDTLTPHFNKMIHFLEELASHYYQDNVEEKQMFEWELDGHLARMRALHKSYLNFCSHADEKNVYWLELIQKNTGPYISAHVTPLDISPIFNKSVLERKSSVILTSATLATNGDFHFIKEELGISDCKELLVNSPFDYHRQMMLYTPILPSPVPGNIEEYKLRVYQELMKHLALFKGRTLVLFTNYSFLKHCYRDLSQEFPELNIIYQGQAPNYELIDQIKKDNSTVIMGTNTFWEGIDIQGDALQSVIIVKLPFTPPDEPIVEARSEYIREQGKSPFNELQLPHAIIKFKQGFGRLIRHRKDIGVVSVLDSRLYAKRYGQSFLNSLPNSTIVHQFREVKEFYEQYKNNG